MDDGYISDYLTHWTGRKVDDPTAFERLGCILEKNLLKLNYHPIVQIDLNHRLRPKMVCFTDAPISKSRKICTEYGKFGIVFDKQGLKKIGAHPVFYYTTSREKDIKVISKFILSENRSKLPKDFIESLERHIYFVQEYSKEPANSPEAPYYYEREWRLGEHNLDDRDPATTPNLKSTRINEGKSYHYGKGVRNGDDVYLNFKEENVCFIIVPRAYSSQAMQLVAGRGFETKIYEDMVD